MIWRAGCRADAQASGRRRGGDGSRSPCVRWQGAPSFQPPQKGQVVRCQLLFAHRWGERRTHPLIASLADAEGFACAVVAEAREPGWPCLLVYGFCDEAVERPVAQRVEHPVSCLIEGPQGAG